MKELKLSDIADYQHYLDHNQEELGHLDSLCRVSISRFYRDKQVFAFLERTVLPEMAEDQECLNMWSLGCGAGEEPYTLSIIWRLCLQKQYPLVRMHVTATDADTHQLERAAQACYSFGSVKNLPTAWMSRAFDTYNEEYCLRPEFRAYCSFVHQDVRRELPEGVFDLVLCRNLVFTYFDEALQRSVLERMLTRLRPGGVLVLGVHESLPQDIECLMTWSERLRVFRKRQ